MRAQLMPRRWCTVALAGAALALTAGSALAGTMFEVDPAGSVTARSLDEMRKLQLTVGLTTIECSATFDLDIDESIEKTEGVRFGTVSRAEARDCTTETDIPAEVEFLGFPWSLTYSTITGELPSEIAEVLFQIRDIQVLVSWTTHRGCRSEETACLYRGDLHVWIPLAHTLPEEPYVNQLMLIWETSVPLQDDELTELECPSTIVVLGQFSWEPTQSIVDL